MVKVRTDVNSSEINQSLRHTLFVEGNNSDSFDPTTLSALFKDINIRIEPLGASYHINSTAQSLYQYHPDYYFLMDRDSQPEAEVETSWQNFPDPSTHNRIIWRKKEIENYFLDPDFATKSKWFIKNRDAFIEKLQDEATKRIYYDAVNRIIVFIREEMKKTWINLFPNANNFSSYDSALQELLNLKETFDIKKKTDASYFKESKLKKLFDENVSLMLGNESTCKVGVGKWLDLMDGKILFKTLVNSNLFKVTDRNYLQLQGNEKLNEVAKSLLILQDHELPSDFVELKKLISNRVYGT